MPRIMVQADPAPGRDAVTVLQERVLPSDLESAHFGAQLLERIIWAIGDAKQAELERDDQEVGRATGRERRRFERGADESDAELEREPALVG